MKNVIGLSENEFRCDRCGGIYEKGKSDDECLAEAIENFGQITVDLVELDTVCEDCYQEYMRAHKS